MQATIVQKNPPHFPPKTPSNPNRRLFPDFPVSADFRSLRYHEEEPAVQFSVYGAGERSSSSANIPVGCLFSGPDFPDKNGFFGNCAPPLAARDRVERGRTSRLFTRVRADDAEERRRQSAPGC